MKKGQIVEGIVERVDFPNKGTVIVEEKAENGEITKHRVEVKGVIPGQKVRLSIKKARKGKAKGMLREVLEKSSIDEIRSLMYTFNLESMNSANSSLIAAFRLESDK